MLPSAVAKQFLPAMTFPENFIWGATTSAYQIEGASDADGRGPSTWDMFTRPSSSSIWEGHDGRVACDHYHRYQSDVGLMKEIGLNAYRFSISWTRIFPEGAGSKNERGLDFYDRLVDQLLEKGIDPWVTLFHWDYPYDLFLRGGWLNPDSPKWFAKYATAVTQRLSDRVSHWITVNEPQCFIGMGHMTGEHAPGLKLQLTEALLAGHHTLLAHGRAVEAIRTHAKKTPLIGWSPALSAFCPETNHAEDIRAARHATLAVYPGSGWNNTWWGDPVVFGHYPEEGLRAYGSAAPRFTEADMKIIQQPIDFYGANIFSSVSVRRAADGSAVAVELPKGAAYTSYGWRHTPEALYWGPRFLAEHYKLPVVITENGMSGFDWQSPDGQVHDTNRIQFMSSHLLQLRRALRENIDIRGYFAWSLLDNFEWNEGYRHRFGLIYVDFDTQERTLKDSALWYRDLIASGGGNLDQFARESTEPLHYVVKQSMHYIHANMRTPFNVQDIATHLRCHPDFLSRKFKKLTGMELSHYIRKTRIEHSMELLKDPNMLIDEAAEQSGFKDRIQFTKVFRRIAGQTPGQYQRQHRLTPALPAPTLSLNPQNPRSSPGNL